MANDNVTCWHNQIFDILICIFTYIMNTIKISQGTAKFKNINKLSLKVVIAFLEDQEQKMKIKFNDDNNYPTTQYPGNLSNE